MISFRQRFLGRRREIYAHIRHGTYGLWLVEQTSQPPPSRPPAREKVLLFRLRWFGNRRYIVEDSEYDTAPSALAPQDLYGSWTSDQRLWAAVLIRAIYDLVHFYLDLPSNKKQNVNLIRLGKEAHLWFDSPRTDTGSYKWVCEVLDMAAHRRLKEAIYTKRRKDLPRQCSSRKRK